MPLRLKIIYSKYLCHICLPWNKPDNSCCEQSNLVDVDQNVSNSDYSSRILFVANNFNNPVDKVDPAKDHTYNRVS